MGQALLQTEPYVSPEDYLAAEAEADTRHEYVDGHILAMAGASEAHNLVKDNLRSELHRRLRGQGCRVTTSDQRVKAGTSYRYPDVVMHCGEGTFSGEHPPMLLNPELLVEVVSVSTAEADRIDKLTEYTELESLQEYWIAEQDRALVTQYVRHGADWRVRFVRGLDASLQSEHFGVEIPMADLYALVDLPVPPTPPTGTPSQTSATPGSEPDAEAS
ncbi:MAG: Uma2 family endonuclease [Rhodothermales bacterium]